MVRCIRCRRRSWGFRRTLVGRFLTTVLLVLMLSGLVNFYISNSYLGHAKQGMNTRENATVGNSLLADHTLKALLKTTQHHREVVGFRTKPMLLDMNSTINISPWDEEEGRRLRHACGQKVYESLPQTSVIITFYEHETLSYLLHTIHSIVQRTPPELLKEIILVDDNSKKDNLKTILDNYVTSVFPGRVKILRPNKHLGLIQARLHGIQEAKADVIAFMDSHMEVQEKWLEPLLHEIQKDRKTLASSYLDWMTKVDVDGGNQIWEYKHGGSTWKTIFDWGLVFRFMDISAEDKRARAGDITAGIPTPCMVGGIFAMEKRFFHEIGDYDSGMQLWGGENIELPLRVWLCGGRVVNVPCSHVAHLEFKGSRSYRDKWTALIEMNYKRLVEVWFDDYKKYFYIERPHLKSVNVTDISERLALRKQCPHDMSWLLKNVYPELGVPDQNSFAWGGLENVGVKRCLNAADGYRVGMDKCHRSPKSQGIFWNRRGEMRLPLFIFSPIPPDNTGAHLQGYDALTRYNTTLNSKWFHVQGSVFMDTKSGLCLEASYSDATLQKCNYTSPSQQWAFQHYTPDYNELETLKVTADRDLKDLHVALAVFVQETRKILNKDSHTTGNARGK